MLSRLARRLFRTSIAAGWLCLSFTSIASASHFRGTTISWSRPDSASKTVTFEIQSVLRADYYSPNPPVIGTHINATEETFVFGDNTASLTPIPYTVESVFSVGPNDQYMSVRATLVHTYARADSFQAMLRDPGRLTNLLNNGGSRAAVFVGVTTSPTRATASPRIVLPPLVTASFGSGASFDLPFVPGSGAAGDSVHVKLTTFRDEALVTFVQPPGAAVGLANSRVHYSFNATSTGRYGYSLSLYQNGASTPIEGVVTVQNPYRIGPTPTLLTPVTADAPAPMTHISAYPNLPLTLSFTASNPSSYYPYWTGVYGGHPPGSSYSTGASPFSLEFHWTPTAGQLGRSYPMFLASEGVKDSLVFGTPDFFYGDDSAHFILDVVTPVLDADGTAGPGRFVLDRCSPSPTRGSATLSFTLGAPSRTSLDVLDVTGRRVRSAVPSAMRAAGRYVVVWDGRDDDGALTPPGVYLVRLLTSSGTASTRLVRLQ